MPQENQNTSNPRKGMNRDKNPIDLSQTEYSFSLNSSIASDTGDTFLMQNELSNILCNNFPQNYAVIGREYDVNSNRTYFMLTNPETNFSQIGYIDNKNNIVNAEDVERECNCDLSNTLAEPLEGQTQVPSCTYTVLLEDSCNGCLNFSVNFPIRKIIIKYEQTGTTLWWTDRRNTLRYLNVDDIEKYGYTGLESCGEDDREPTCLDCEKLRVFKQFEQPTITAEAIQQGGQLPAGVYEVLIAYSDLTGNEISSYYSITNPISIFDPSNTILQQNELQYITDYGIRLNVDSLDTTYPYYKVAITYTGGINQGTTYYAGEVYSTSNKEVVLTSLQNYQPVSIQRLSVPKIVYNKADGLTSSNGTLFWHGTTEEEEINLQPIANLLGGFLRWQTVETKEDLYADGVNSSLYRGFMRDEVYPFAIQILFDNGYATADFPLINRPPNELDLSEVDNKDTQSINKYVSNCTDNPRTKYWQYYNTATDEGSFGLDDVGDEYNIIEREVVKTCTVDGVYTQEELTLDIDCSIDYTNFAEYIDRHRVQICTPASPFYNSDLCEILSDEYAETTCNLLDLFDSNCAMPVTLVPNSTEVYLESSENESLEVVYQPIEDMLPTQTPNYCNAYKIGSNDQGYENDTVFQADYMEVGEAVWKRNSPGNNNECIYPANLIPTTTASTTTFFEYDGATLITDLQTDKTSAVSTGFTGFVHTKALWYKIEFGEQEKLIFEITKTPECTLSDDISVAEEIRYTTFNTCSDTVYTESGLIDVFTGGLVTLNAVDYPSGFALIAIDSPIETKTDSFVITPPCGCFAVLSRLFQCSSRTVTIENLSFSKRADYSTTCEFKVPLNAGCTPTPFRYGKFGYWESTTTYPDNKELYDSTSLVIDTDTMPAEYVQEFRDNYVQNGAIISDFTCQPIRHYKFPDFAIAPYMGTDSLTLPFSSANIYPLGVTIDEELINFFLDAAVQNNLMTQQQRNRVSGYKIKAGNRTLNKSIVAKGIANDMFSYNEIGSSDTTPVLFPNFPYNDNHQNILLHPNKDRNSNIQHPFNGDLNNNYTFHSPETSFGKPSLPAEMKIEAYQFGSSRGNFVAVEDHVKEVVLGKDAYTLATTLAIIETTLELITNLTEFGILAAGNTYTDIKVGTSSGIGQNFVGAGVSAGLLIAYGVASVASTALKTGQYRKQWLDILNDLGEPRNFASYYTSVGDYNYARPNTEQGEMLRAIKTSKYLKPGNYQFTEEVTGETVKINNRDRESAVFLSTGEDYPIIYPSFYKNYDNSRTIASEASNCEASTVERQIASPYFSLKNYIPNQYGQIGNVQWISTGYTGDLKNPKQFPQIFGGDTFISRFTKKIKHSLFNSTGMGLANRTPFAYSLENNVGVPRFFADFYTTSSNGFSNALFPDLSTDYTFDCTTGANDTYVKNPSKFYLFYYGIPYFLVESEINVNYRYAKNGLEQNFYPNTEDYINWTQEKNVPIREDNTYFYNAVYSKKTTQIGNRALPIDYSSEYFKSIVYQPNNVFYSVQDNSDLARFEPWLAYKPLDSYKFKNDLGRLIDLADIESAQVLGRFENGMLIFNSIDILRERLDVATVETGNGGIFAQRPIEFKRTKLGYMGTQHTEMVSCELGHFWVDAKRGQILQLDQSGKESKDITVGMTRWMKEQLPFKILKYIADADVDNAYNGVGITMTWDSKNKRVFVTKKDFIPKDDCVVFDSELGWVVNESLCGESPVITCPTGYIYNPTTEKCEKETVISRCPDGYFYSEDSQDCVQVNTTILEPCPPSLGYFAGGSFDNNLASHRRIYNSEFNALDITNGVVYEIKRQPDGKILVGGGFQNTSEGVIRGLFRLNYDGTFDSDFAANIGLGFQNPLTTAIPSVNSIDIYPDGRILIGGDFSTFNGEANNRGLIRLNSDGTKDYSLNIGTGFNAVVGAVKIVENEKILASTLSTYQGQLTKNLIKLTSTGDIDTDFQGGARFASTLYPPTTRYIETIEVQPDGKYLIGGDFGEYSGNLASRIVRIGVNGNYDTSFITGVGFDDSDTQLNGYVYKIQMQKGKILVGGQFTSYKGTPVQGIVRLILNGDLDPTFNNTKIVGSGVRRAVYDFDTKQDGEILMGGTYTEYDGNGVPYITRTDINGFPTSIIDPDFDNTVFTVLNEPRCEECDGNLCNSEPLEDGTIACNCEEHLPALACQGECEPQGANCECVLQVDPTIEDVLTPIDITDENYFTDVSWTAAYSPLTESWISYYSFKPNYYVAHQDYFQSGLNSGAGKGIWSHLLTNRSYQVFYGQLYPWILEVPAKPSLDKKILSSVNFIVDSERYHNEYDSATFPKIGMDEMIVWNATNNSGRIKLVAEEKNNIYQKTQYPITNADNQEVLVTKYDDMFNVNYFYNRVKSEDNNIPVWIKDASDVNKIINMDNITYRSPLPERMKGNWFLIRFYKTMSSQIKSVFKFSTTKENLYP